MTLKKLITYCLVLILVAALTFFIHFLVNVSIEESVTVNQLIYSYSINLLLASSVIILIFVLQKKLHHQLGFVFMGASLLKFAFFFILFYPEYHNDGVLSRLEFLTFFIPYVICLITESVILSRFLNGLDNFNG